MKASGFRSADGVAPGVAPNVWRALGGIWRLALRRTFTPLHWLGLLGTLTILALVCLGFLTGRQGPPLYLTWVSGFYVGLLVPAIAYLSAAGAMRDELKASTTDYVFTRPVRRPVFLVGRYFAHLACAQVDILCALAVVVGAGMYRDAPGILAAVPLLLLGQVLLVTAFSALGFLWGVVTSRYAVAGLCYAAVVEVGVGQIPTQLNQLSMTHQVTALLKTLTEPAVEASALGTAGLLLGFAVALLVLAAAIFSRREFTGQVES